MPLINEMFAFIVTEEEGSEGIPAIQLDDKWIPLVGADKDRVDSLRIAALRIKNLSGKRIRLVKFTQIEELGDV